MQRGSGFGAQRTWLRRTRRESVGWGSLRCLLVSGRSFLQGEGGKMVSFNGWTGTVIVEGVSFYQVLLGQRNSPNSQKILHLSHSGRLLRR